MDVRDSVLKSLEVARKEKSIGAPLEARVHLRANPDLYPLLEAYSADLPALFIVSQVSLEPLAEGALEVRVDRAAGSKCERCWKYSTALGAHPQWPTICPPCADAVAEILNA